MEKEESVTFKNKLGERNSTFPELTWFTLALFIYYTAQATDHVTSRRTGSGRREKRTRFLSQLPVDC
jgi:hypothetical protein